MRSSVSVASTLLTQNNAQTYSYQNDGNLERERYAYGNASGDFTWTYSAGGRELTQSDPLKGLTITRYNTSGTAIGTTTYGSKTYSYDSFGRIASLTLPQNYAETSISYDSEDEKTGFAGQLPNGITSLGQTLTLNNRGELVRAQSTWPTGTTGYQTVQSQSADGTLMGGGTDVDPSTAVDEIDARSGMLLQKGTSTTTGTDVFSYDAAGRQTQVVDTRVRCSGCQPQAITYPRTYDAENHLIAGSSVTDPCSNEICGNSFGYGADGHLRTMNTPQNTRYTLHWDGGDVLFTDFGSAASVVLYVGKLGEVDSSGNLTVVDRDESGTSASVRSRFGWTPWSAALPYLASQKQLNTKGGGSVTPGYDQGSDPSNPAPGLPGAIGMSRADGYNSGDFEFQGVRVHDDTSSQWLTPDAYAGDVSDPMSQKPFMWNGNNPVEYGDPSGYCIECFILPFEMALRPVPVAADGTVRGNLSFSQRTVRSNFSDQGRFAHKSIGDVASALVNGNLHPKDVPVRIIKLKGTSYILDNRSAPALTEAGISQRFWNIQNVSGDPAQRHNLLDRLKRHRIRPGEKVQAAPEIEPN